MSWQKWRRKNFLPWNDSKKKFFMKKIFFWGRRKWLCRKLLDNNYTLGQKKRGNDMRKYFSRMRNLHIYRDRKREILNVNFLPVEQFWRSIVSFWLVFNRKFQSTQVHAPTQHLPSLLIQIFTIEILKNQISFMINR